MAEPPPGFPFNSANNNLAVQTQRQLQDEQRLDRENKALRQDVARLTQENKHLDRETERMHQKIQRFAQENALLRSDNQHLAREAEHMSKQLQELAEVFNIRSQADERSQPSQSRFSRMLNRARNGHDQTPAKKALLPTFENALDVPQGGRANTAKSDFASPFERPVNGQARTLSTVSNAVNSSVPSNLSMRAKPEPQAPKGPPTYHDKDTNVNPFAAKAAPLPSKEPSAKASSVDTKADQGSSSNALIPAVAHQGYGPPVKRSQAQISEERAGKRIKHVNPRLTLEGLPYEIRLKIYKHLDFPVVARALQLTINGKTTPSTFPIGIKVKAQYLAGWEKTKCLVYEPLIAADGTKTGEYSRQELHPYPPLRFVNKNIFHELNDVLYSHSLFSLSYSTFRTLHASCMPKFIPLMFQCLKACTIGPFCDGQLRRNSPAPRFQEPTMAMFLTVLTYVAKSCPRLQLLAITFSNSADFARNKTPKADRWHSMDLRTTTNTYAGLMMLLPELSVLTAGCAGELFEGIGDLQALNSPERHAELKRFFREVFQKMFVERDVSTATQVTLWKKWKAALVMGE